ncbi:MAG: nitroreductase family protein [Candidatus Omnitrophica bacterium]|nr:nitroreductase family protein [Candidatus Omnitrophota bacterium]
MDVFEAIKTRRSIRSYQQDPIEEEKLQIILEAGRWAPSASNRQEWRFIVVRDKARREALSVAAKNQIFVKEAPVVIACCAETDGHLMTCGQACYPIDIAIAIDHMTLAAVELGLGTCWVGAFYPDQVRAILSIPEDIKIVELLTLGYPKTSPFGPHDRLAIDKIVFSEKWGNFYRPTEHF